MLADHLMFLGIVEKAQAVADILKKLEINEGVNMFSAMHDDVAIFAEVCVFIFYFHI